MLIISLALGTLLIGMVILVYQLWSNSRAKAQGEHADGSKSRPNA